MKKIGGSLGALSAIAKGTKPYDAATVKTSLSAISESAKAFPDQFPAGSETGFETSAAPAICRTWQISSRAPRSLARMRTQFLPPCRQTRLALPRLSKSSAQTAAAATSPIA